MTKFILIIFSLLIIYLINKYRTFIAKKTKLIDKPNKIRKLHKKSTPLLGGIMVFSSFFLLNLYLTFSQLLTKSSLIIFISCTSCLILGLVDDIKQISYKYKFSILIIIFYLSVSLDPNLQINKIYFSTFNMWVYLDYVSILFTVLCLLLLTNSLNLVDGIDGLCILISIIFIAWLINTFENREPLYNVLIAALTCVFYLNLKKNIFLGDSGSLFLGSLIGLNAILNYNLEISKIYSPVENIFIAFMVPGLDMLRVFTVRLLNNKNPFLPDRLHLHYMLLDLGLHPIKILLIFFIIILVPIIITQYINTFQVLTIFLYVFLYFCLIFYLNKITSNK